MARRRGDHCGPSALEVARGWVHGPAAPVEPPADALPEAPLEALEAAILPALREAPCVIAFSGGRDSSLLLAVAARAARREGLPLPIPSTVRYPHLPGTDESAWQERVVRHVGIEDWERIDLTDELDCIGPVAQAEIRREGGPLFPPNAHSAVPHLPTAAGGTLMMGLGGDELFISHRWRPLNDMLAGRRRPNRGDLKLLAEAAVPRVLRGPRTEEADIPWLRPGAAGALARLRAWDLDDPIAFDRSVLETAGSRALRLGLATIRRIVAAGGAKLSTPLLDPRFVVALARAGGARGFGPRTATMRVVGRDVLPDDVLARHDKIVFDDVFFTRISREFAARWSGEGLDDELVDPEVLRDMWSRPRPDFRSAMLLQAAWLHDDRAKASRPALAVAR